MQSLMFSVYFCEDLEQMDEQLPVRRMVVKDLMWNTLLKAKHHLGLLLFFSHRMEQTNAVTFYYNKRLKGYLCDFYFSSTSILCDFRFIQKNMHRNTNERCRCFLPDINVGHNIAIVSGQRQFLPLSLAYNECDMFGFFYTHQILFIKSKRKPRFV